MPVKFPANLSVCTGKKYFFEIKDGANIRSVLDRKRQRILRRSADIATLKHELAHAYLDTAWRILPYSVAEPFSQAMATDESCKLLQNRTSRDLSERWRTRSELDACGLLQLLKDVLDAAPNERENLH